MASPFPRGAGLGSELGVGGSLRRMEGFGASKLFGSEIRPKAPPVMKQASGASGFGPTPGKPATSAGIHNVMPHIRHWS